MNRFGLAAAALLLAGIAALLFLRPESTGTGAPADRGVPGDPAERTGALVDQIVFTQESDVGKVTGLIEAGTHHVFGQGVTSTTVFQRLRDSERAAYDLAFGSSMELTVNPAGPHFASGELNPFYVREVREALNWLINRRYVAEELYGGLAVPRFLPLNTVFPDYARLAEAARALELRYQHDPVRAERVIQREMERLGATREDGRWVYQGQPVRVSVLIRTEDARKRVGDYVANLMEDLGFRVERLYRTAEEASRIWIAGDPHAGRWHLYTGGWISTVINRDLAENFSYYYTPRGRPDPLWQVYTPDPEFDEAADRLQRRDYESWDEREALMTRALELAMQDSVRVWVADQLNVLPHAREVELAVDLAGGISGSRLWPYTIRFRDRVGGRVVFAVPNLLTEPWNPVAGSNWIFDTMIMRALGDIELIPDPFTGLYWPQRIERAELTVQEGVPVVRSHDWLSLETAERIEVPEDTWIDWDGAAGRFVTVAERHPEGVTARTRTRVLYEPGYLERQWHDGSPVSLADMVLPWILSFERADENSALFDPSHVPTFEVFQRHFRGWRIVSQDPLVIEIYSDQIYPDAETIVAARTPSASPWHTLALGIRAEAAGDLAFSSLKADRERLTWMSLVAGPSLAILDRHLDAALHDGFVPFPEALADFVGADEAGARFRALADWREARGHFWVGDGPFYLHSVHALERTLVLRRFEDFPDRSDKWLRFTRPAIPELELDGPMVVEAGAAAEFTLRATFDGEPYPLDDIENVQYLLFDGVGSLVRRGSPEADGPGSWRLRLEPDTIAALGTGANSLEFAVISRRVALPSFASQVFATLPAPSAARNGGSR
ncbi:solute binding protein-like protein [Thioalkalivibrio nitratireducens DSM 14787]|uniref:Solute binding protein-like protein n=1 Tax=Thioalkalivibrio nitratireducens (strain DSM 14787 / UNIQEM 213 / ALEN2) TaxID=1255043 RepID=L0DWM1_THIND|nr:solute-binding protein [Thioalkalivibrio nitratireducens]AGA33999.1 solute binding protein-like protein [Thioalkalivibrio nitratireducens DSM 14787]